MILFGGLDNKSHAIREIFCEIAATEIWHETAFYRFHWG